MNTYIVRYNRHLGVIAIVGLALLMGCFDLTVAALRGPGFDDLHTPLGRLITAVASQFTAAPSATRAGTDRKELVAALFLGASALRTLLFAALAWWRIGPTPGHGTAGAQALLAAQLLLGLCGDADLLYVLSAELGLLLPLRRSLGWLLLQLLLYAGAQLAIAHGAVVFSDDQMRLRLLYLGMELIFHCIVFGMVLLATRERRGRRALAAAHAELLATQSLLADTVRDAERQRIARDLHDSVGHHLTALHLHLDLAVRQAAAPLPAALATARGLAGALLAEVRAVVSSERHARGIDLRGALLALCAGIPAPRIRLVMDTDLAITSPAIAHALFRCAQEAVSNAVRHAGASTLTIEIAERGDDLVLVATDDGAGAAGAAEGNGLRGMRERVELLGGRLQCGAPSARGYALQVTLPAHGGAR